MKIVREHINEGVKHLSGKSQKEIINSFKNSSFIDFYKFFLEYWDKRVKMNSEILNTFPLIIQFWNEFIKKDIDIIETEVNDNKIEIQFEKFPFERFRIGIVQFSLTQNKNDDFVIFKYLNTKKKGNQINLYNINDLKQVL